MARDSVARIDSGRPEPGDPFDTIPVDEARSALRVQVKRNIEHVELNRRLGEDNDRMRALLAEQEADVRQRMQVLWPTDAVEITPIPQLVGGILAKGGFALGYGESGTGKSTLGMDLGMHVASGKPWRGRPVSRGLVLHLAGEGLHGLRLRLAAAIREDIGSAAMPYAIVSGALNLASAEGVVDLLSTVRTAESEAGEKAALVIVDTLARCATVDENDGAEVGRVIGACDQIREATGAAVLLIHHSGKDATRGARGHSSLRAAVDTELLVEGRCNPRTLTVTKQRDLPTAEPMSFDLVPIKVATDLETFEDTTACVVRHSDQAPALVKPSGKKQAALLAELEHRYVGGEITWTDADLRRIGRDIGMSKSTARYAVLGLTSALYLGPSVGGLTLMQPPEVNA